MVQMLWSDISERWARELLHDLETKGCIKQADGFDSTTQNIYRVTNKACVLFGLGNSHMRKRMSPVTLKKNLLRAHFLFQNINLADYRAVCTTANRVDYLRSLGIDNSLIPRKINKGDVTLQIEEPFLITPLFAPNDGICVVIVDIDSCNERVRLNTVVDRYVPIIRSNKIPILFLSIVENSWRGKLYKHSYEKLKIKNTPMPKMDVYSIEHCYSNLLFAL